MTSPETRIDQPSAVSSGNSGGSALLAITPTTVPIASSLNAESSTCMGSPSHMSAAFIPPVKRRRMNESGLPSALRRHRSARNQTPSRAAGTDTQLIVIGTKPYL